MDGLEAQIKKDADGMLKSIDIKDVIDDPEKIFLAVVEEWKKKIIDSYFQVAVKHGKELAVVIKQHKIEVVKTRDPKLNAESENQG